MFSGSVNHIHAIGFAAQTVRKVTGAVGRIIVHHDDVDAWVLFEDTRDDAREVVHLVVGGNDHEEVCIPITHDLPSP